MKLLVTGGTGFTGSALVKGLIDKGHDVTTLDIQKGLFFNELREKGAKIVTGSVTDHDCVRKCLQDIEGVFHLAAAFRNVTDSHKTYTQVNKNGTQVLCEESLKAGVKKFVYCSTQGVHGDIKSPPGADQFSSIPNKNGSDA